MVLRLTLLAILFASSAYTCAQESPVKPEKPTNGSPSNERASNPERPRTQDPDKIPPSDRESHDVFFRTLSETRSRGAQEFSYLLFQESVRKEINLSEESAKAAREVLSQTRTSAEKLYEQLKAKEITADELKTKMLEIMTNADRDIWKTLVESNSKSDRLIGLFVQHRHCTAVLNKVVAEKVGLDEARRLEIIAAKEAVQKNMFEERSRETQSGDRFRAWEKVQKKVDAEVSAMLTEEQRNKLEQLKGEPFKFEEFQFPPGRGREGGRDGGRNRRDGHDEKCKEADKLADDR